MPQREAVDVVAGRLPAPRPGRRWDHDVDGDAGQHGRRAPTPVIGPLSHPRPSTRWQGRQRWGIAVVPLLAVGALVAACGHAPATSTRSAAGKAAAPGSGPGGNAARRAPTTTEPVAHGTASTPAAGVPATAGTTTTPGDGCRGGDPLANVYHPYRLHVEDPCLTVTGTVAYVRNEPDGDVHVDLSLPASEAHLLDAANVAHQDGQLVTEIVPADQPGCTVGQPPPLPPTAYRSSSYDYGTCTGADVATPPLGARVSITGPYVVDADHGWMEIHPVWAIRVESGALSAPATGAPAPSRATTAPAPEPAHPSVASCEASASPANDGYPGDYQVHVQSDQPDTKATASDAADTWSEDTNSSGYADIRLYHTSPGMPITVTVGGATCSTTA